jgi:hypothetical protein
MACATQHIAAGDIYPARFLVFLVRSITSAEGDKVGVNRWARRLRSAIGGSQLFLAR